MASTPAQRRYNRGALLLMSGYALILFGVVSYFRNHPGTATPAAYVIAILPALPLLGVFFILGRYLVDERDEYLRMMVVRQLLIATALTLSVSTVWGFLEGFDLVPHLVGWWWATLWFLGLDIGAIVNKLTMGSWG